MMSHITILTTLIMLPAATTQTQEANPRDGPDHAARGHDDEIAGAL